METVVETPVLKVVKVPDVGPEANNAYLIVDRATNESAFVDAPADPEAWIAMAAGTTPVALLITHSHDDHTPSIDLLKERFGLRVYCHPDEPWIDEGVIDVPLEAGQEIAIGATTWRAIFNPGHTPGSTSFFRHDMHGGILFSGDTLFPGGPGWSASPMHLRQEIESIQKELLTLPPETLVLPGHGPGTTIRDAHAEFKYFEARTHPDNLHGDVRWLPEPVR